MERKIFVCNCNGSMFEKVEYPKNGYICSDCGKYLKSYDVFKPYVHPFKKMFLVFLDICFYICLSPITFFILFLLSLFLVIMTVYDFLFPEKI